MITPYKNFRKTRKNEEINASSMADIAFLLLIFFLVTTTIASEKGLLMILPPKLDDPHIAEIPERNLFKILINENDQLLIEENEANIKEINTLTKGFVNNNGLSGQLSDSPQKAIVSIKCSRGTSYDAYLAVLDEVKRAYHELRADYLHITPEKYQQLDHKKTAENAMIEDAKKAFPMNISEAEMKVPK
jgi:biopolymer transport protein ExbD